MNSNKIKIGFVGFGRVVEWQIKQIKDLNIKISFICDSSQERLSQSSELVPNATLYKNIDEVIENENSNTIDYVIIATPSGSHYEIAEKISKRKSWKLVIEKPTFLSSEHFFNAKKWKNTIIPVFQNRYNKSVIKALELINNQNLGKLSHASLSLDWSRPQRYYDLASWRGTWENDGGVSTNQGIHYFDIARHLIGNFKKVNAKMKRLTAEIECEDYLNAFFEMSCGIPLDVRMTTAAHFMKEEASLTIHGSKGFLKLYGTCCNYIDFHSKDKTINSYGEDIEIPYGYGHKTFFSLLSNDCDQKELNLPSLEDSFETMQFIYSSYESAINGIESFPKDKYNDVFLGKNIKEKIIFE